MPNLKSRIRGGESATLEFKATCPEAIKLARVIASFANCLGGEICIGVDDLGRVVGVDDIVEQKRIAVEACELIDMVVETKVETLVHELKDVLIVTVTPLEYPEICHVQKGGEEVSYFRVSKESRPVPREVEKAVIRLRRHAKGDRSVTPEGQKLIDWLWAKGEAKEPNCAGKLNFSSRRLRKLAEDLIGGGYLLPCNLRSGRSYVAIHSGPKNQ